MISKKLKENIKQAISALDEWQYFFITTAHATSFYLPYFLPYTVRKLKEPNDKNNEDFTEAGMFGSYSGFICGICLNIAQVNLYMNYGIENENYALLLIPAATNVGSGIYEYLRKRDLESKIQK
ncbi:hypothetical protein J4230_02485 [Candidatus Woesearchaeota archaeon]|nr:hypothetical protein [Candidatus Woesearchaeota archaeon]